MTEVTLPAELFGAEPKDKVMEALRAAARGDDVALHMASELGNRNLNAAHRNALFGWVDRYLNESKAPPSVAKIIADDFQGVATDELHIVLNTAASGSDSARRLASAAEIPEPHRTKLNEHIENLLRSRA